jgi:hypothetical protein
VARLNTVLEIKQMSHIGSPDKEKFLGTLDDLVRDSQRRGDVIEVQYSTASTPYGMPYFSALVIARGPI